MQGPDLDFGQALGKTQAACTEHLCLKMQVSAGHKHVPTVKGEEQLMVVPFDTVVCMGINSKNAN